MLNPAPFCQVFLIHYMVFQVLPLRSIPSNVTAAMYFLRPMTELKQKKIPLSSSDTSKSPLMGNPYSGATIYQNPIQCL